MQKTLSILKPDAVSKNLIGKINALIESSDLKIIASKMMRLTKTQAESFYVVHKDRPFFKDLVEFMTSGPVLVQVLYGKDAVTKYRKIMGDTDPKKAAKGTIRAEFADSIDANCAHGSDSLENAKKEISFFFADYEVLQY